MRKHIKNLVHITLFFSVTFVCAQRTQNDTINTDVIDVVKPYTPSVSDAFKVKETPTLDDAVTENKKQVTYNIFSIPVASTFTPAKGKAEVVEKAPQMKLYDNYATLGGGSYTTILGELYLNHALSRTESVGGYLSHHSSQGNIAGEPFNTDFSNSKINANYSSRLRDLAWNVEGGFQRQTYNWYGVPDALIAQAQTDNIVPDHSFWSAHFGGDISFEDTYINSGSFIFRRFGDNQGSGENRFRFKTTVDIPINGEELSTDLMFDYLGGRFDRSYELDEELNYGNWQIGVSSQYELKQDDLTVNLGASLFYLNEQETGDSKFYIYPNITASYRLVNDVLIAYGGIEGGLIQNSYYGFATENPFVSPTLFIMPTDQLYDAYAGLKGKLSSNMSYNVNGFYQADRNRALFKSNTTLMPVVDAESYQYGNSFGIVYDDIKTYGVAGEINVDVNRNFKLGIKAEYFNYSTDDEAEAWNLPDIKGSLFLDYQITQQWFAGANLFYIGERNAFNGTTSETVILDSYFDANAHVGYNINDKISVFAKANNMVGENYEKWINFPVQGVQILGGATFKFDF